MFYAGVSLAAAAAAAYVLVSALGAWRGRRAGEARSGSRRVGLGLLALGAGFFVVAAIDPPGADLGEDLRFGAVVDDLGGGFALTGYALALLLLSLLLLGAANPIRCSRLLTLLGIAAVPFMGALTVVTVLFDRGEWRSSNVGPFMGSLVFFTVPAMITGALLAARR